MCGIGGWFGRYGVKDVHEVVDALRHRGPDGSGVWQSERATLVHTRLAILDLSEAGAQPMEFQRFGNRGLETEERVIFSQNLSSKIQSSKSPSYVLVFNGEIYNHEELREELEAQGETFVGHSDTEVLLRLLVLEDVKCLAKLAGMFAFAFWNEETGEALLARDAYGIKPLYYRETSDGCAFASESGVLKKAGDAIDVEALRDFFLWGSVPEPATLTPDIRQLPSGHLMKWKDGKVVIKAWHTEQKSESKIHNSESPAALTRTALEESMRRHLVSDVPVGIFLSGGIDSTAVLALTRQALGPKADIRTFSIGFDDPAFDESSLARRTAEHFGATHTEWRMTPEEGAAEIPGFLGATDQPSIDGFNTWCVSKLARSEGMKVVLSGLGGDEWFAGYGSFNRVPQFHWFYQNLRPMRRVVAGILKCLPTGSPWQRLAAFLQGQGAWLAAFHAQRGVFTAKEAAQLAVTLSGNIPKAPVWEMPDLPQDPKAIVSAMEVRRYMRNQLLRDSDVFSMAHGLELRVPLVDVRLAETLLGLPPEERLRQGKQLLLEAVPEIPEWIRNQPKRGFRFPFQQWMEGQFGDLLDEAHQVAPIQLKAWYRTWAVAVALRLIGRR